MTRLWLLVASLATALAHPAQAACWDDTTLAAARLYEFHIRVESAGDRCHYAALSIDREYREYFANHGDRLNGAAARLNAVLSEANGFAKRTPDKYTVSVLNRYGAGSRSTAFCSTIRRMLAKLADPASTTDDLHTYALVMVREPAIENFCPTRLAQGSGPVGE